MNNVISFTAFKASQLLEDGRFHISTGNLELAIETLQKSIEIEEKAETLTHLAWVLSLKDQVDDAKELCLRAIQLDPDYGNPYNDLGNCFMKEQRWEEAIFWLEKAKLTKRYDTRHFPHMNLGRVYSTLGRLDEAINEFTRALEIVPQHQEIIRVLEQLQELKQNKV